MQINRLIHRVVYISLAMLMSVATGLACAEDVPARLPAYEPGEVLVTLKSSVTGVARLARDIPGVAAVEHVARDVHRVRLQPDETVASMMDRLKKDPMVVHVQPNYIKYLQTNDPDYGQQWGLHNTGQTAGTFGVDISAEAAWQVTRGSRDVVVAVLDTGIAGGASNPHQDLKNSLWRNPDETVDGIDNDANGCIDDLIGCNFSDPDKPTGDVVDPDGHGTLVAGIIEAEADNGIGISGVSPGASLMIINIFNGATTSTASIVAAIDYAIAMGADVINASFGKMGPACCPGGGTQGFDDFEYNAIKKAGDHGILVIAPSGNGTNNDEIGIDNDSASSQVMPMVPASYNLENIVAVAAIDHDDHLAGFSNWGVNSVDLAAPGVAIHSTYLGDSYVNGSGTSLAVGFVTGTVALMLSVTGDHTINGLKNRLLNSVDPVTELNGIIASGGRLNAAAAVLADVGGNNQDRSRQYTTGGGGGVGISILLLAAVAVLCQWIRVRADREQPSR